MINKYCCVIVCFIFMIAFKFNGLSADEVLHLEVDNKTGKQIHDLVVLSGNTRCQLGLLPHGASATILDFSKPMSTNAFVEFTALGVKNKFEVSLKEVYSSESRDGKLVFTLYPTNAMVAFKPDE